MRRAFVPLALAAAGVPALAQEDAGTGPRLTAEISQRFEVDSNYDLEDPRPGTSYFADTRFAAGLINETPTQVFALDFDTGLRALWKADEDFEFTFASPSSATAAYAQEWASGALDTRLRYRQSRVDFDRPFDDFLDPDTGVIILPDDPSQREGDTTERRYDANFGLELGTDSRSSYGFGLAASRIDYSDPAEDRTPRDTVAGDLTWGLQLTPLIGTELAGRYYYYTAEDDEDTRITEAEVDASLVFTPSEVLAFSVGLGYVDREREERDAAGVRQTVEDESGLAVRATVRYDFEEFIVGGTARYADIEDGRFSGDLRLTYPLVNSRVTGRLFQSYAGGAEGDEIRVTGGAIGLLRDLDAVSRIEFDIAASRRENQDDPDDPDSDRLEFTTTYGYDFTELLTANVGYRFRTLDEDPDDAQSHAVFVEISRSFETRP